MFACCGLCSIRLLPPSQRQLPSLLLWLQYSISLSAFEFQSKPEADCKQMDGVIKSPQAGSKEARGCKRKVPLEEHIPAPMLGSCLSGHLLTFCWKHTKHAFFTFTYPNSTWLSRLSTRPRFSRQPSVTLSPRPYTSPPNQPPDCSHFWAPKVLTPTTLAWVSTTQYRQDCWQFFLLVLSLNVDSRLKIRKHLPLYD